MRPNGALIEHSQGNIGYISSAVQSAPAKINVDPTIGAALMNRSVSGRNGFSAIAFRGAVLSAAIGAGFLVLPPASAFAQDAAPAAAPAPAPAATPEDPLVAKGKYLATIGDCISCHTRPGGEEFAGGLPLKTPFGTIYTANITPDKDSGIGGWSEALSAVRR